MDPAHKGKDDKDEIDGDEDGEEVGVDVDVDVEGEGKGKGKDNQPNIVHVASTLEQHLTPADVVGEDVQLVTTATDDNRSYHISSQKIREDLGFQARHTIRDAVTDLLAAFEKSQLPNSLEDEIYFNIRRMQSLNLQ